MGGVVFLVGSARACYGGWRWILSLKGNAIHPVVYFEMSVNIGMALSRLSANG